MSLASAPLSAVLARYRRLRATGGLLIPTTAGAPSVPEHTALIPAPTRKGVVKRELFVVVEDALGDPHDVTGAAGRHDFSAPENARVTLRLRETDEKGNTFEDHRPLSFTAGGDLPSPADGLGVEAKAEPPAKEPETPTPPSDRAPGEPTATPTGNAPEGHGGFAVGGSHKDKDAASK